MNVIRFIHKWLGWVSGIFIFILCLTGMFIIIGKLSGSYAPIFRWMRNLHCTLFMSDTGSTIVGVATLLLLVEVITGYFLWCKIARLQIKAAKKKGKSLYSALCNFFSWTKPSKRWGWHLNGGFWCGLPLILMALTGLTWSFGWYGSMVNYLFDSSGSGNLFHTIASLHTGSFLGTWSRILWLAAAGLGASLPITGLMISLKKYIK